MKILQCIQNDVVFNFNDIIIIARCALNIESTLYVAILKEALAIRRIFSLVDMITKAKFLNSPNDFKIRLFG